jgi:hypothetical protein
LKIPEINGSWVTGGRREDFQLTGKPFVRVRPADAIHDVESFVPTVGWEFLKILPHHAPGHVLPTGVIQPEEGRAVRMFNVPLIGAEL